MNLNLVSNLICKTVILHQLNCSWNNLWVCKVKRLLKYYAYNFSQFSLRAMSKKSVSFILCGYEWKWDVSKSTYVQQITRREIIWLLISSWNRILQASELIFIHFSVLFFVFFVTHLTIQLKAFINKINTILYPLHLKEIKFCFEPVFTLYVMRLTFGNQIARSFHINWLCNVQLLQLLLLLVGVAWGLQYLNNVTIIIKGV